MAKAIPDGYGTITAHMTVSDIDRTIEWYKNGLGAEELYRMPGPGGAIMHAEFKLGNSIFMIAQAGMMDAKSPKELGGTHGGLLIYTEDCDALFNRAVAAGATVKMPPADQFWGDRWAMVVDPSGHEWQFATHKEDVSQEEMGRRMQEMMKQMAQKQG